MTPKSTIHFLDRTAPPTILTLTLLAGVSALNTSIFLPSLAAMTEYFGTDYSIMQLSVSAYLLATAGLQVLIGPISDRFGRRAMVLWSLAIFLAATLGCLFAPTIEIFLAFRLLQSVVAGGVVLSRAIVRDMVPGPEAASMIGYVTMGMSLVPMLGPMIGGALDQFWNWHATFVFLMISGGLVLWLCWADLGETNSNHGTRFLQQVRTWPELFGSPRFWGYVLSAGLGSGAFFALLGGGSYVADTIFGLSPLQSGIALGAPALGYAVGNGISGRWSVRMGINRMALIGAVIAAGGMLVSLLSGLFGLEDPYYFFGCCTFLGVGNGMLLPNTTAGSLSVRPHLAGTAGGIGGAFMIGGGAALSALAGIILTGQSSVLPLQWLMFVTTALAVVSMLFVIRRDGVHLEA
jgi:DHA1 family bicyclomycin/chloramphenicol resistance-like MFS transporter